MVLKIVCLNIWCGGILTENLLDFLEKQAADIVMLQEVYDLDDQSVPSHYRSLSMIQKRLQYPYQDFAPASYDRFPWGNVKSGNAILSKLPIRSRDVTFFYGKLDENNERQPFGDAAANSTTPRNLQHVELESSIGSINIYNLQGVWDLDGDRVSEDRRTMVDTIIQKIAGKKHVIVGGDTNAKETNPLMCEIEDHLTSVFRGRLTTTFNMRRKTNPGYASAVVDMIYVSDDFQVLTKQCPDIDISDHLPLVVELKEITEEVS